MRRWLVATMATFLACAMGCSSSPSQPSGAVLRGTYEAVTPGAYLRMTFYDAQHFFLFRSPCDTTNAESANACLESGTYALDTGRHLLALRNVRTKAITELPFDVLETSPGIAFEPLHVLGGSLTNGSGTSLTSGAGSSISTGADAALTHGDGGLTVGDGGKLSFGDGGSLTTDGGGNLVSGYNAGGQQFQGGGADGGTSASLTGMADSGGTTMPASSGSGSSPGSMSPGSGNGGGGGSGSSPGSGGGSSAPGSSGPGSSGPGSSTPASGLDAGSSAPSDAGACTAGQPPTGMCATGNTSQQINLLYEGSCNFLKQCDSYSKHAPAGDVVFGCTGTTACNASLAFVAGPAHSYCGKVVTFCTSGGQCTCGTIMDVSNVGGWEGSPAVMQGLGFSYNDGTCSNGGSGGGNVTVTY